MNTRQVLEALTGHYRKPGETRDGEILITEVQAPGSQRRADLVRVGMWQSRGTGIDVHEIKVSRSDWLRELADPAKAEAWWPYCNRFWITAPPGVVEAGELPEGWGLLELPPGARRRFKVRAQAESRKDIRLTVPLIIELLRRADNARLTQIVQLQQQHRDDLYRVEREWRQEKADQQVPAELRSRLEMLKAVEAAMGMRLGEYRDWTPPGEGPAKITAHELAAYMADAKAHVTLQRRREDLVRQEQRLRDAAGSVLRDLNRAVTEAAASGR
jgi:hypothetical protein